MSIRTLLVCPGRGSYDRGQLGYLSDRSPAAREAIAACDDHRRAQGRRPVSELDAADRYRAAWHVAGENASLLTAACSLADRAELSAEHRVVGVVGNSMGFYTALALAGALSRADAIRLIDTMGAYQAGHVIGGQLLYPLTDPDWQPDPARRQAVDEALRAAREAGHVAAWSIDLGSHAVLGADDDGVRVLQRALPPEERGSRTFPVRLPLHSAFHTPLMQDTSTRARRDLADLGFRPPEVPLIDGRGVVFRPRWAAPEALRDYTLGHQVVRPFDFRTALRTALRHCGPERVVLLGPGNALGAPTATVLVQEDWQGAGTREAFRQRQGDDPILLSFGLPEQRERLC